jgi:putative addiction module component (TIGR02574 family)
VKGVVLNPLASPAADLGRANINTAHRTAHRLPQFRSLPYRGIELQNHGLVKSAEQMTTAAEQVLQTALSLPAIDRAAIVELLLATLDQPDCALDECWAVEAESRLAAFDAGETKAIPADVVFEEFDSL